MAENSITLGGMVAGLLQWIVIMGIFMPVAGGCINPTTHQSVCAIPSGFNASYTGLLTNSSRSLNSSILHNVSIQAANTSTGVPAAVNNPQFTIGGFLYAGIGFLLTDMQNIGPITFNIFSTSLSQITEFQYVGLAFLATLSAAVAAYMGFIISMKFISMIQKVIAEQV